MANNTHQIIREKREFNHVLVHLVENRNILAKKGQHIVLFNFGQCRSKFHKREKVIEDVDDRVAVIMDFVQDSGSAEQILGFQFAQIVFELHIRNI